MQQLLDFPWHHDIILHEAGVPPLHTPIRVLSELDADIKARLEPALDKPGLEWHWPGAGLAFVRSGPGDGPSTGPGGAGLGTGPAFVRSGAAWSAPG